MMTETATTAVPAASSIQDASQPQQQSLSFLQRAQAAKSRDRMEATKVYASTVKAEATGSQPPITPDQFGSLLQHLGKNERDFLKDVARAKAISHRDSERSRLPGILAQRDQHGSQIDQLVEELEAVTAPIESRLSDARHAYQVHDNQRELIDRIPEPEREAIPSEYADFVDDGGKNFGAQHWFQKLNSLAGRRIQEGQRLQADLESLRNGSPTTAKMDQGASAESIASRIESAEVNMQAALQQGQAAKLLADQIRERLDLLTSWLDPATGLFVPQAAPHELPKVSINARRWS
ncbi:hypothetical protein [Fuerstiella marisgermanici]|uniref:Uncharacterized protein n=1 Tax=Fuerstiella marisgermanici TaxID=1891926 RepID=A0A1P8WB93_9PLAN|nr:hypothetical protein [Fuerstiella marisgermanici]APZ91306.1 hypothetical protein Fuma_00894 [Fuerstiella marisgermanici]